jgi:hypothetical protein
MKPTVLMTLFPESLLENLQSLPGASHSFLKQLSSQSGGETRDWLQAVTTSVDDDLCTWWTDQLMSLDNRRFFQAFSEMLAVHRLQEVSWTVEGMDWPGPILKVRSPEGDAMDLLVLSFVRPLRPTLDRATRSQLTRSLNRVRSQARISVLVQRWMPHDFDPDPVRRSIELWLGEVDRGTWESRYATYEDDHISLEFALTGDRCTDEASPIAFTLGPLEGQSFIEALETRLVYHLDRLRLTSEGEPRPMLVSCVTDQPWQIAPGYLRDLFLGRPSRLSVLENGLMEQVFPAQVTASIFRDPLYRHVCGVWLAERVRQNPLELSNQVYLNPWGDKNLRAEHMPGLSLQLDRWDNEEAVMRWAQPAL